MKLVLKVSLLSLLLVCSGLLWAGGLFATGKDPKGPEKSGAISKPDIVALKESSPKVFQKKFVKVRKAPFTR